MQTAKTQQVIGREVINGSFLSINNSDLKSTMQSVLGSTAEVNYVRPNRGTGVMFRATLSEYQVDIPEFGGVMIPQLFLLNTNDGTRALTVGAGFFRLVCSNGLIIAFGDSLNAKIRHLNGPKANNFLDILPEILMAQVERIKSGEFLYTVYDALDTEVKNPLQVIGNLPVQNTVKDKAFDLILTDKVRVQDNIHTAWGVYNLVNELVRRHSQSSYGAYTKDIGLLDHVIALAQAA